MCLLKSHVCRNRMFSCIWASCTDSWYTGEENDAHCSPYSREGLKDLLQNSCQVMEKSMCLFSKHFVLRTSFRDVFYPFYWWSMLSSHVVFPLGLFPFVFNCITTLSIDSSFLRMTRSNHWSVFLSITWTMDSLLVSMIPPELLTIVLSCTLVVVLFKLSHSQWNPILPSPVTICGII